MGKNGGTNSGLGGFVNGGSIRFSKNKNGAGGVDAWRDQLMNAKTFQSSARPRTTGIKIPKLHSVHEAAVVSLQSFGVFVQLGKGDVYKDGLLHVSAIGNTRVESPQEAGLEMGMKLYVKINDISDKEFKYGLDMRFVSQRDGKDMDPFNGKSKVPDNYWYKGVFVKNIPKEEDDEEPAPAPAAEKDKAEEKEKTHGKKRKADSDSGSEVSSDVGKRLKKARKKLEKMKKKAEKAKKKEDKKSKKEKKKKSSESGASGDHCSRSS